MARKVLASGLQAVAETRQKTVKTAEDMTDGTLFGLNASGLAVKATNLAGSVIKAVGMVYEGSARLWGEGFVENPDRVLRAGEYVDIIPFHRVGVTEATYSIAQVAGKTPVYLGTAGEFTTILPSGVGTLIQRVGIIVGRSTVDIDLTIDLGTLATA